MKNILLCVTGGIAVYKAVALTSKLVQEGFSVKVMMTKSACEFVNPISFQAISRDFVYTDTFDEKEPQYVSHIQLADWADIVIIAPMTANMIGKLANGIADDMISTTLLATQAPVFFAPAMNVHMYQHPIIIENMNKLQHIGYKIIEPNEGYLACGYVGKGRMSEPEEIVDFVKDFLSTKKKNEMSLNISGFPVRKRKDETLEIVATSKNYSQVNSKQVFDLFFSFQDEQSIYTVDDLWKVFQKNNITHIYDTSGLFSEKYPYKEDIPSWLQTLINDKIIILTSFE